MTPSSLPRALAATLVFLVIVALSLPLGLPLGNRYAREGQEALLGDLEKKMEGGARFHRPATPPVFPPPAAFCGTCHPLPPHGGEGVATAMNNHHSSIFDCLVCHWARRSGSRPALTWNLWAQEEAADEDAGREKLVLRLADPSEGAVREMATLREKLLPTQKCFDRGMECRACHRSGSMAPYARPGMPDEVKAQLEKLSDFFTLPGGSKWYFPQRL